MNTEWLGRARRIGERILGPLRNTFNAVVAPLLAHWWGNPLLVAARQQHPMSPVIFRRALPIGTGALAALAVISWLLNLREIGAGLVGVSIGVMLIVVLAAPVTGSAQTASHWRNIPRGSPQSVSASPLDTVWGLALIALWSLRWAVLVGIAFTPALMIGLLRLDIAGFSAFRDSVQSLGSAAPPEAASQLLPGGGIPYGRLVIRAVSAGLLPWAGLPLLASFGVITTLWLREVAMAQLAGMIAAVLWLLGMGAFWLLITATPLLAGPLEVIRLLIVLAGMGGLGRVTLWINQQSAELLVIADDENAMIK